MKRKKEDYISIKSDLKDTLTLALERYKRDLFKSDEKIKNRLDEMKLIDDALQQIYEQTTSSSLDVVSKEQEGCDLLQSFWALRKGSTNVLYGMTLDLQILEVHYHFVKGFTLQIGNELILVTKDLLLAAEKFLELVSESNEGNQGIGEMVKNNPTSDSTQQM